LAKAYAFVGRIDQQNSYPRESFAFVDWQWWCSARLAAQARDRRTNDWRRAPNSHGAGLKRHPIWKFTLERVITDVSQRPQDRRLCCGGTVESIATRSRRRRALFPRRGGAAAAAFCP